MKSLKHGNAHPIKVGLNKKFDPKKKTIQAFNVNAKEFRNLEMKILPRGK